MAEPHEILAAIEKLWGNDTASIGARGPLTGRHVLITAGPTHEPIDPVRYIANRSSGKQGYALAAAARALGARVTLVSGPTDLPIPHGVFVSRVESAREMLKTVEAALPADVVPRSLAEGYAVQEQLVRKLLAGSGGRPVGYKIACTSVLAQKALGVDGPFFGVLMSHSTYPNGATLRGTDFTVRCAEAEFGFEMAADVPPGPVYTADTIREFVGAAIPSIEIVDHRYHDWQAVGAPSLLADNAIHGAWVRNR